MSEFLLEAHLRKKRRKLKIKKAKKLYNMAQMILESSSENNEDKFTSFLNAVNVFLKENGLPEERASYISKKINLLAYNKDNNAIAVFKKFMEDPETSAIVEKTLQYEVKKKELDKQINLRNKYIVLLIAFPIVLVIIARLKKIPLLKFLKRLPLFVKVIFVMIAAYLVYGTIRAAKKVNELSVELNNLKPELINGLTNIATKLEQRIRENPGLLKRLSSVFGFLNK